MHVIQLQYLLLTIQESAILGIDYFRLYSNFEYPPRAGDGTLELIE